MALVMVVDASMIVRVRGGLRTDIVSVVVKPRILLRCGGGGSTYCCGLRLAAVRDLLGKMEYIISPCCFHCRILINIFRVRTKMKIFISNIITSALKQ